MRRYPEYKASGVDWIGEIPKHWKIVRGKFILSNKKEINSDLQCNNLLSLTLNGVLRKDMNSSEGLIPSDYRTYQVFYPDNLVFKLIDLENIQTSRVGIVPEKGIMSPVYIRLKCNSDLHERYYFYQYYDLYKKHIFNFLGKGVRSSLSPSNLLEIPLAFPLPFEQTQIANFLDRKTEQIDEFIRIKERQIKLLQEQRTTLINQAVTKGLDPNVEMKPSGVEWIGEIPRHWTITRLKYLGESTIGLSYKPENVTDDKNGILVLRASNIQNGKPSFLDNVYVDTEVNEKLRLKEGDILICSRSGSRDLIGKNMTITKKLEGVTFGVFMTIFRTKFVRFISCFLNSQVFKNQSGLFLTSTINQLTINTLNNFLICFPPDEGEQAQIANFLDHKTEQIDELISTEQQKIKLLKEYRQSLISEAVTGKIDVRNEV